MDIGLSLGSNLGDRLGNLRRAGDMLSAFPGITLIAKSAVYETEPVGVRPEFTDKAFLNAVIIVTGEADLKALSAGIHRIEAELGRVRTGDPNAPREIDIDIVFAGSLSVRSPGLSVPHPRWAERRFVVQPLADVRPDLVIPGETRTVREVLCALPAEPKVVVFSRDWKQRAC